MTTLNDVAKKAGVSYSTVSRALAGSTLINAATRERIIRVAEGTGYQVNHVARSLATRRSFTLGLVVPETTNPYFPKLIDLIVHHARIAGYSLLLNISGTDQSEEGRCLQALHQRRVDGIILTSGLHGIVGREEIDLLQDRELPLVVLGWVPEAEKYDLVACDDAAGGYELTNHLLSLGHRRIALLGPKVCRDKYDRIQGFLRAMAECPGAQPRVQTGIYTEQEANTAVHELLGSDDSPTAFIGFNDMEATWIVNSLSDAGISCPQEVALAGFGDMDVARYLSPRLTTVAYPIETVAESAVTMLLNRISAKVDLSVRQHVMLQPHLVIRQSCGAPKQFKF